MSDLSFASSDAAFPSAGRRARYSRRVTALGLLCIVQCLGCGNSGFGNVSGRVTLNGEPLENAFVEFSPTSGQGSTSSGRTNKEGEYSLDFSRSQTGALVGEHTVRITTRDIVADENGNDRWLPEKVPKQYNAESELRREVKSGSNQMDFELVASP